MTEKTILDVCCGGRMFYYDKNDPRVLFQDIRVVEPREYYPGQTFSVEPDVLADFTDMPYDDDSFSLVVFDPPHLPLPKNGTPGLIHLKYGHLEGDWRQTISRGFSECFRVLKPGGFLIFKWSEARVKLSDVLALTSEKPIFGHRTTRAGTTIWLCFQKNHNRSSE